MKLMRKKYLFIVAILIFTLLPFGSVHALDKGETGKRVTGMKGTYFTGTYGAGGKLSPGRDIALNRAQMKSLGIKYGDIVYVKASRKAFTGLFRVRDTGCRSGIIDINLTNAQARATGISSFGVYKASLKVIKKEYQKKYRKLWKKQKPVGKARSAK